MLETKIRSGVVGRDVGGAQVVLCVCQRDVAASLEAHVAQVAAGPARWQRDGECNPRVVARSWNVQVRPLQQAQIGVEVRVLAL